MVWDTRCLQTPTTWDSAAPWRKAQRESAELESETQDLDIEGNPAG